MRIKTTITKITSNERYLLRQKILNLLPMTQAKLCSKLTVSNGTIYKIISELVKDRFITNIQTGNTYLLELDPTYVEDMKRQKDELNTVISSDDEISVYIDPDDKRSCVNIKKAIVELKKDPESLFNDSEFVKKIRNVDKKGE